jgi:transposase
LANYADGKGEVVKEAAKYNDDRLGRCCLDRLYKADRNSLMTDISGNAIKIHALETEILHNDTTSRTKRGAYNNCTTTNGIKPARGYNKDGHPDCKQIVFGLNVTEDGHVPISYMAYDGNIRYHETHIPNWNKLRELLGKDNFIYVTDSKGGDMENLGHIASNGGKFISMMPASRREAKEFYTSLKTEKIPWEKGYCLENSRKKGEITTYLTFEAKSREGYRIVWVHSVSYAQQDAGHRQRKIAVVCKNLQTLSSKRGSYQLKNRAQIQQAVLTALEGVGDYVVCKIIEHTTTISKQIGRGKAGPNTRTKEVSQTSYQLDWQRNIAAIREAACTDGVFPLISNTELSATEVLRTYKQQPYLEKRHSTLKTVEQVCPVYLKKPQRIEAMLFLYFVGLMIISLIERNIRNKMQESTANDFAFILEEPVISASDKQIVLPDDRVLPLPNKNQTVSLKEQELSNEQTTISFEMIRSFDTSPTAVLKEQSALPEKDSQRVLPIERIEPSIVIKHHTLPLDTKPIILSKKRNTAKFSS